MNENQWWSTKIKPVWHNVQRGRVARKVQDLVNKGMPDVDLCFNGVAAKVELKWCPSEHRDKGHVYTFSTYAKKKTDPDYDGMTRATVLSREQFRNLEEWHLAGGHAFVMIGIARSWWLIPFDRVINLGMTISEMDVQASCFGDLKGVIKAAAYIEGLKDDV